MGLTLGWLGWVCVFACQCVVTWRDVAREVMSCHVEIMVNDDGNVKANVMAQAMVVVMAHATAHVIEHSVVNMLVIVPVKVLVDDHVN